MQISFGMRKEPEGGRVHGPGLGESLWDEFGSDEASSSSAVRPVARIWSSGHQPAV